MIIGIGHELFTMLFDIRKLKALAMFRLQYFSIVFLHESWYIDFFILFYYFFLCFKISVLVTSKFFNWLIYFLAFNWWKWMKVTASAFPIFLSCTFILSFCISANANSSLLINITDKIKMASIYLAFQTFRFWRQRLDFMKSLLQLWTLLLYIRPLWWHIIFAIARW